MFTIHTAREESGNKDYSWWLPVKKGGIAGWPVRLAFWEIGFEGALRGIHRYLMYLTLHIVNLGGNEMCVLVADDDCSYACCLHDGNLAERR